MSDHPADPSVSIGALCADAAGRRAAVLMLGETRIYDLIAGRRIATIHAEGPSISLSPDGRWLAATDGVIRDALTGEPAWRAPFSGLVRFIGEDELLVIGLGQLLLIHGRSGYRRALICDDRLDPSGVARLIVGPGGVAALVDPAGGGPVLIDLDGERLVELEGQPGPALDACFVGEALTAVCDGGLSTWALRDGRLVEAARPHGAQALAVSARGRELVSAGVERDGRWTLRSGSAVVPLPGRAPPTPALDHIETGWVVDTWAGVVVAGPEGIRHTLELPEGKDGARPFRAARPVLVAGERLLLACQPPFVYDHRLRFLARLEPDEG